MPPKGSNLHKPIAAPVLYLHADDWCLSRVNDVEYHPSHKLADFITTRRHLASSYHGSFTADARIGEIRTWSYNRRCS